MSKFSITAIIHVRAAVKAWKGELSDVVIRARSRDERRKEADVSYRDLADKVEQINEAYLPAVKAEIGSCGTIRRKLFENSAVKTARKIGEELKPYGITLDEEAVRAFFR